MQPFYFRYVDALPYQSPAGLVYHTRYLHRYMGPLPIYAREGFQIAKQSPRFALFPQKILIYSQLTSESSAQVCAHCSIHG